MDKYKANRNEDFENNIQNKEDKKSTENVLKAGLDVAEHIPVASMYAKIAKMSDVTMHASKILNKGVQNAPLENITQGDINEKNDGISDSVSKTENSTSGNLTNPLKLKNPFVNMNKNNSKKNSDESITKKIMNSIPTALKIKIYAGLFGFIFFLMLFVSVFAEQDEVNLGLTNNLNLSLNSGTVTRKCSAEEVENRLLYVGDSRIVGLQSAVENESIQYIAETGQGYDWLNSTALSSIESKIAENPNSVIVLSLGINDLTNIENYVKAYNSLMNKFPDNIFYILSINPVDESKTISNGFSFTNSDIEKFNKELYNNFPNNFIDSYSGLSNINTTDGLHYDNETYNSLNNFITNSISNSGKVLCQTSGGNVSTCSLTVVGDKYYKTLYPQTESCQVTGFYSDNSWGLEPNFYANINALIEDAETHGCSASIISGHRTRERQAYFYNCYITKSCNNGNLAAQPGYGNHEYGIAADLSYSPSTNTCISYFHNNAGNFGLAYNVRSENWHIEPSNIIYGTP